MDQAEIGYEDRTLTFFWCFLCRKQIISAIAVENSKRENQQNFGPAICFRIIEFLACSICWSKEWHLQVLWTFALFHPFGSELWTLQRRDFFLGGMRFLGRKQWSPTVPTTMVLVMEWAILRPDGRKETEVCWGWVCIWDLRFRLWFVWS